MQTLSCFLSSGASPVPATASFPNLERIFDVTPSSSGGVPAVEFKGADLIQVGKVTEPVLKLLAVYSPEFPCLIEGAAKYAPRLAKTFEGNQIKRGILRDFPTRYRDRAGNEVKVPFQVLRVTRDDRTEPFRVEPMENGARIRIGDANVMLTLNTTLTSDLP